MTPFDAVVTHHRDRFRSGVAGFNHVLAERLSIPLVGLDGMTEALRHPLLSFKVRELGEADERLVSRMVEEPPFSWDVFLHDYVDLPLERLLVERARHVHCGNLEIEERVRDLNPRCETLWAPGLLLDQREFQEVDISVFSFGMAHKLRADMFRKLRALLEASGRSYALYASAANHETASLGETEIVFEEMRALFPERMFFLGNLSDVAVWHYLGNCDFYAAFFRDGVRANNSSVASALERGAVVITNLDAHSPPELVHMDNVIDIRRCSRLPDDPELLGRIRARAIETARPRGWEALIQRLTARPGAPLEARIGT